MAGTPLQAGAQPGTGPQAGRLAAARGEARRLWRLARVLMHIGTGFALALGTGALFVQHRPLQRRAARWWLAQLTAIVGARIRVHGAPPAQAALYVCNHVSWLDIAVLGGQVPVHFLSKAEVGQWPLIGRLATAAGTLYIHRGRGQVRERTRQVAAHVAAGRPVIVFPEGTTTDGRDVRAFHAPLFAAATDGGCLLQPLALRYRDAAGRPHARVPFIGDDEFHTHLWQLLREDCIEVELAFLPPRQARGEDPRALAESVHAGVRAFVRG